MFGTSRSLLRFLWEYLLYFNMPWRAAFFIGALLLIIFLVRLLVRAIYAGRETLLDLLLLPEYLFAKLQIKRRGTVSAWGSWWGAFLHKVACLLPAPKRSSFHIGGKGFILTGLGIALVVMLIWYGRAPARNQPVLVSVIDSIIGSWASFESFLLTGQSANYDYYFDYSTSTIAKGDTLNGLAQEFQTLPDYIVDANAERYPSLKQDRANIKTGWKLIIPIRRALPGQPFYIPPPLSPSPSPTPKKR